MDGQYPPPFPPMGAFYSSGPPPMYPPEPFPPRLHQLQTISMESLGTYSDYDDSNRNVLPAPPGQRQRRRQHSGSEHVKHRRTRSGCYTCRQRRVKCDETHPVCDRCRKGKRECIYPGASTSAASSSKPSRKGSKAGESNESASSASEDEEGDGNQLPLRKAANLLMPHSLLPEARLPALQKLDPALEMLVGPKQTERRQNTQSSQASHIVAGGLDFPET
ncbi:hypothetical protein KC343_g21235 [Hortaea werneckii]|nr:hypothetical protein KC317_g21304 [Hortaea werneckii]KAI7565380.1 hypothetical protein KC346_g21283 [Hortaea werneckii]KAI7578745.1 hypothetical protein KC343_g21235 [Hortaea werneckii]